METRPLSDDDLKLQAPIALPVDLDAEWLDLGFAKFALGDGPVVDVAIKPGCYASNTAPSTWSSKTPDQILADVNALLAEVDAANAPEPEYALPPGYRWDFDRIVADKGTWLYDWMMKAMAELARERMR